MRPVFTSSHQPAGALIALAVLAAMLLGTNARGQAAVTRSLRTNESRVAPYELVELFRVGSMAGAQDAFGRVLSVALDSRGRLYVADDQEPSIVVFNERGTFVRRIGRKGAGPGEFDNVWQIAVDTHDSLFAWDPSHARVTVFDHRGDYARSFAVPTNWRVTSIRFLPSGELLLSAFGTSEVDGLHVLRRDGTRRESFARIEQTVSLPRFHGSVLGGTADVFGSVLVYSRKSPYDVSFYRSGRVSSRCTSSENLTTPPNEVIEVVAQGSILHWNRFVHSSAIILLDSTTALNTIIDPINDTRIVDIVSSDCTLVRRTKNRASGIFASRFANRVASIRNGEFPEVIVYEIRKTG